MSATTSTVCSAVATSEPPPGRGRRKRVAYRCFLASVAALLAAGFLHEQTLFVAALTGYALMAGWWVFEDQRTPQGGRSARLIAAAAVVVGGWTMLAGVLGWDSGFFVGAVVLYLGVGVLVTELRTALFTHPPTDAEPGKSQDLGSRGGLERIRALVDELLVRPRGHRHWLGPGLTIGCVALLLLSIVLLGTTPLLVALGGIAAAVLVLPVAVGLWSEQLLVTWARRGRGAVPFLVGLTVVVLAAVLMALGDVPTGVLVGGGLVLGLLVLGITSNTQTDIVLVVALVAFVMYQTANDVPDTERHTLPGGGPAVAVFGDSYMSGEGARSFFAGTDNSDSNECRRAPTAYAARLVDMDPARFPRLAFLACSAAKAEDIYGHAQYPDEPRHDLLPRDGEEGGLSQVAHYRALQQAQPFDVKFAVVSIGGNDSGFSTIGMTCLAPGDCSSRGSLWTDNLDTVRREVGKAYDAVRAAVPDRPVVVVPYPVPLADVVRCDAVWLEPSERAWLIDFVEQLNATIAAEVRGRPGFHYVDTMPDSLQGMRLCDRADKLGVNFIGLRSVSGLPSQRLNPSNWVHNSLHPNELGHERMAQRLSQWLDRPGALERSAPLPADLAWTAQAAREAPAGKPLQTQCSLTDTSHTGCRGQAQQWALAEIRAAALSVGGIPAAALAGLWLMSLGTLMRFRSRTARRVAEDR